MSDREPVLGTSVPKLQALCHSTGPKMYSLVSLPKMKQDIFVNTSAHVLVYKNKITLNIMSLKYTYLYLYCDSLIIP